MSSATRARDRLIAAVLAVLTVAWMLAVEGQQGIGRDEAQYMRAGEHYWGWFAELADNVREGHTRRSFTPKAIDRYWSDNAPDHPVVMKILFGVSWRLFHGREAAAGRPLHPIPYTLEHGALPIFPRASTAFRLPAIAMAALLVVLVFWFARRFVDPVAAAVAAVLAIAQPHTFFHAQIACFDAPVTTMAIAVAFAYWKSLRSARWGVATGVIYGLALGTKHNAWLMPAFLVAHWLWMRRGDWLRLRPPPIPLAFVSMAVLGPILFFLHWPWLWVDPVARARAYFNRHLEHEHYNFEYLGRNWNNPPKEWDRKLLRVTFPFVETGLTLPVTTLVLAGVGAWAFASRRRARVGRPAGEVTAASDALFLAGDGAGPRLAEDTTGGGFRRYLKACARPGADVDASPGSFLVAQFLGPMAIVALPSTPIFGGVKHFMPAFPFLAVCAGVGARHVMRQLRDLVPQRWPRTLPLGTGLLLCAPAVAETQRSHPDGLAHYNLLAGGFAGGASLGMNRQFWGYSVRPMLGWMAAHAPARGNIYWHDVLPDALSMYVRDGVMPPLGNAGGGEDAIRRSDLGLIILERHMVLYEGVFWESYRTTRPAYVRTREGVPVVTVYRRAGVP